MKSITKQKTTEEIQQGLKGLDRVFVVGCGTCTTMTKTGGVDTLFIGVEETPGFFREAGAQCGQCILGETAGICPITACHKGLVNGPCGGTNNGKCEVDKNRDCAWTLVHE